MKKFIVVCGLLALMMSPAFAQMYVRFNVGYNLPLGSQLLGYEMEYDDTPAGETETQRGIYGSFGSGFSGQVAFGGLFKGGTFGYDVELGYLLGRKYTSASYYNTELYQMYDDHEQFARSFMLAPSLTFTTGTGKFQPFARVGPVFSNTTLREKHVSTDVYSGDTDNEVYGYKYTGGLSVGFKGVIGVTYTISETIQVYTQIDFIALSYSPRKRIMTEFTINGDDRLDDMDEEDKEIKFEKEYTTEDSELYSPPLRPTFPMSSMGMQFGIKFIF